MTVALRDIVDRHTNDGQDDSADCDGCGVDVTGTAAKRLATCPELRAIAAIWDNHPEAPDHIRREVPPTPMYRVHNLSGLGDLAPQSLLGIAVARADPAIGDVVQVSHDNGRTWK